MKLKKDYVLRQVADTWVVLPLGQETISFDGMLKLNESGALLWKALEEGSDTDGLVAALKAEYIVSEAQARADAEEFLQKLAQAGCIES